jgi:two-component system nitrogen regulation response regulator GlnG
MAPGEQVFPEDLPVDQSPQTGSEGSEGWPEQLRDWMRRSLKSGRPDLMAAAREQLERVALDCALEYTNGKRIEAARLLGLGRNTLTRKLKELEGVEAGDG